MSAALRRTNCAETKSRRSAAGIQAIRDARDSIGDPLADGKRAIDSRQLVAFQAGTGREPTPFIRAAKLTTWTSAPDAR